MRKDITAVINTVEVMIVLEVIVPCRWPLVALAYASPETMWLYIPFTTSALYQSINGNHEGHSSREAPKSENNAVMLTALLFIVYNDKGFPRLWLIKCYHWCNLILCRMIAYGWEFIQSGFPRSKSMTVMNWAMTCLYHHSGEFLLSFWLKMAFLALGLIFFLQRVWW